MTKKLIFFHENYVLQAIVKKADHRLSNQSNIVQMIALQSSSKNILLTADPQMCRFIRLY